MDAARALMDQLMGKQRDLAADDKSRHKRHFWDSDIDKFYLCGLNPHTLFFNTRVDLGPSGKEEDEECKAEWDALSQDEKDKYGYEHDLMTKLQELVRSCDSTIEKNKARVAKEVQLSPEDMEKLAKVKKQITELTSKMEELGDMGQVDDAQALIIEIDGLMKEKQTIEMGLDKPGMLKSTETKQKTMYVCEVSGNFMCSTDNGTRLKNHYEGKLYKGWKACRDKLKELEARCVPYVAEHRRPRHDREGNLLVDRDSSRRSSYSRRDDRDKRGDSGRDRERDSRESRDRRGDRDRDRDRDRSRGERSDRDRARGGERDRDKGRDRDRDRGRDRDRDRDRDRRDRDRDRDRDRERRDKKPSRSRSPPRDKAEKEEQLADKEEPEKGEVSAGTSDNKA
eukprot:CAMPEP_0175161822 /NCGR_PEP_ID=MMETSP0087-20121206/24817_1 /TAXON_ID=136419 /ORGANISM="Unknown Unknown, Strain D1" /LENGTH=395 /DNA_ID=CAMNT_0016450277 /DNA_START=34 /DNA_END=1221 /DNA_ORIENTATION=+